MKARPSTTDDLLRVRTHQWVTKTGPRRSCDVCTLEFSAEQALRELPSCPGPGYRLTYVGEENR